MYKDTYVIRLAAQRIKWEEMGESERTVQKRKERISDQRLTGRPHIILLKIQETLSAFF